MRAGERASYLFKLADLIEKNAGALAELETRNNGKPLREPYLRSKVPWELNSVTLGEGDYFVMGDNRATSWLGLVSLERIIGKVVY